MIMEQQVLDLHEKRVNYIQLKYYIYITTAWHKNIV